jgi:hypothetical protein
MKVKNVSQTIKMTAMMIMPSANAMTPEMFTKLKELGSASEENKLKILQELKTMYPAKMLKDLETLGLNTPMDTVDSTLTLSSFLFDIYVSGKKPPVAPLALKIYEKEMLDLAAKMKGLEEFEVPEEMMDILLDMVKDDDKWQTAKIHVEVDTKKEKLSIPLVHKVANLFPEVLEAAMKMFMEYMNARKANS